MIVKMIMMTNQKPLKLQSISFLGRWTRSGSRRTPLTTFSRAGRPRRRRAGLRGRLDVGRRLLCLDGLLLPLDHVLGEHHEDGAERIMEAWTDALHERIGLLLGEVGGQLGHCLDEVEALDATIIGICSRDQLENWTSLIRDQLNAAAGMRILISLAKELHDGNTTQGGRSDTVPD